MIVGVLEPFVLLDRRCVGQMNFMSLVHQAVDQPVPIEGRRCRGADPDSPRAAGRSMADRWAAAFDTQPDLVHRSTPSRCYSSADRSRRTTSFPSPPSTLKFDRSNLRPTGETG